MEPTVDWAAFPGPRHYVPGKVEDAFACLQHVRDDQSSNSAYNRVLFAVGNNHAGTAYPAAVAAVTKLAELVLNSRGLVTTTALEALVSLLNFGPEPGFESFRRLDGSLVQLTEELASSIKPFEERFLSQLTDPTEPDEVRSDLLLAICDVAEPVRLRSTLQRLLASRPSTSLARDLQAVLDDLP